MPTLIVHQPNRRFGGRITGRVLIGRLPTNGIPLTDSNVSRLHAWIAPNGHDRHYIADTGSLTGTSVNGASIVRRRDLADGDVIQVGNARISYFTTDNLPLDIERVDLAGMPAALNVQDAGVLFDCPCGAPAWFKATAIGHTHQCRQCGRSIRIPAQPNTVAQEISPPSIGEPGVPPATGSLAAPQDLGDPFLLHEPGSLDTGAPHDEHGLADSGVHPAEFENEPEPAPAQPAEELSLEDALSAGNELELEAEGPVNALLDEVALVESTTPDVEPPPVESETLEPVTAEEILDLSASEAAPAATTTCSVCHTAINAGDAQSVCPSCGLTFHAECWKENLGCSAYGCPQVNSLKPPEPQPQIAAKISEGQPAVQFAPGPEIGEPAAFPWEFLFLVAGVAGALLGALCYGVPAMIALLGTLVYTLLMQESPRRRPIAWIAVLLCVIGIGVGIYVSHLYWKGWPPIGPWATSARAPSGMKP